MLIVTGATGHIGNVLVKRLVKSGHDVGIVTHVRNAELIFEGYKVTEFKGDMNDKAFLEKVLEKAEGVFHLAAKISIQSGEFNELYKTNVLGTKNLMEIALAKKTPKVLYVSSVHALLEQPDGKVITEIVPEDTSNILGDYAKTKILAYHEVQKAFQKGLNVITVFPTGVIGPFDYKPSQIGQVIKNFLKGKKNYYFDGKYNYVDVRDVVEGIIRAYEAGESGEGYTLGGAVASTLEIYEILAQKTHIKLNVGKINSKLALFIGTIAEIYAKITHTPALITPYSVRVLQSNCNISSDKARKELGFKYRPIKESIEDAVEWHKKNKLKIKN